MLALSVAALPLLLDRCAQDCESHRGRTASTPACHHEAQTGAHISHAALPCGHDHHGAAVVAIKSVVPRQMSTIVATVVDAQSTSCVLGALDRRISAHSPPGSSLVLHTQSLPLRL